MENIEIYSNNKDSYKQIAYEQRTPTKGTKVKPKIKITLWDLPRNTKAVQIRRCLSFFGLARVKEYMPFGKNEAAFIELMLCNETKLEIIKKMWAVHFNKGKVI